MLLMVDRDILSGAAFGDEASLAGGFLMLDRKDFDGAGGVGEADLV